MAARWYEIAGTVLYYASLPLLKLVYLILALLQLILAPFVYLGRATLQLCALPFNIAAKFEPVWYFIAYAILIGIVTALILHGVFRTFVFVLRLNEKPVPKISHIPARGHDINSYRKAREKKKMQAEKEQKEIEATAQALATSPLLKEALKQMRRDSPNEDGGSPGARIRGRESLYSQTILEHTEEDDS